MLGGEVMLTEAKDAPTLRVSKDLAGWRVTESQELLEEPMRRLDHAMGRAVRSVRFQCPPQAVSVHDDPRRSFPRRREHAALQAARLRVSELLQEIEARHTQIILKSVRLSLFGSSMSHAQTHPTRPSFPSDQRSPV